MRGYALPPVSRTTFAQGQYGAAVITRSPPQGGLELLELFDGLRVQARGKIFPTVVGHDEDDVALVHLAGDAVRHARDRARRDAREDALLLEQLARPDD